MSIGTSSRRTVVAAVDLANLYLEGAEQVSASELREVLELLVGDEEVVDPDAFAELAGRIREVFVAEDGAARVERLNVLLDRFQPSPQVVAHDGQQPHFHYVSSGGPSVEHVGATFAMALANVLVEDGADRFGQCAAPSCERLFFDRSRSRTQRFCSKSCATRVHVRAHRARS